MKWFYLTLYIAWLTCLVDAHHGGGGRTRHHVRHGKHHDGHHDHMGHTTRHPIGGGASVIESQEDIDEIQDELAPEVFEMDIDNDVSVDDPENATMVAKPKLFHFGIWNGMRQNNQPEKLIVFNTERYGNWSEWSRCLTRECIEVRHRKCLDESWKQPIPNKIHTTNCLSKYYAEKRTCSNRTQCNSHIGAQMIEQLADTCGIQSKQSQLIAKITGGKPATPHSWPWAVRISVKAPRQKAISFCGGTLIAPQWIVTAAHCLLVENKRMPVGRPIKLADYMRSIIYAHVGDHNEDKKERAQQDFRVTSAILHPKYHRKLMTDGDDIALLYLNEPVNITKEVNFACLPPKDLRLKPGTRCYAVGWGKTNRGRAPTFDNLGGLFDSMFLPFPQLFGSSRLFGRRQPFYSMRRRSRARIPKDTTDDLHEVQLPIVGIQECGRHYTDLNEAVHICAGTKGKDTCAGDSGGGLYCQLPKSDQWVVTGVTSFGLARGCGLNPGVYTSISAHLDWVSKELAKPQN